MASSSLTLPPSEFNLNKRIDFDFGGNYRTLLRSISSQAGLSSRRAARNRLIVRLMSLYYFESNRCASQNKSRNRSPLEQNSPFRCSCFRYSQLFLPIVLKSRPYRTRSRSWTALLQTRKTKSMAEPQLKTKEVLWDWYTSLASKITRPSLQSTFLATGSITPQEFVEAGDLLVHKCGSWSWYVISIVIFACFSQ